MDKKISLDIAQQHYYISIPCAHQQTMFSSVFAYDALLKSINDTPGMTLYGYCLFSDHIHILVYSETKVSTWLEAWLMRYNQWHQDTTTNNVYLFHDEEITTLLIQPKYLCKILRHLHYLPIHRKLCSAPEQYLYSSYHDYLLDQSTGVDTTPILSILSPHYGQRIRRFQDYMAVSNQEPKHLFDQGNDEYYYAYADSPYLTQARASYQHNSDDMTEDSFLEIWRSCIESLIQTQGYDQDIWLGKHRHHSLNDAHFILAWMYVTVAKGPVYLAAKQLNIDETTLKLKINSIHLHHPAKYLRYIEHSWNPIAV